MASTLAFRRLSAPCRVRLIPCFITVKHYLRSVSHFWYLTSIRVFKHCCNILFHGRCYGHSTRGKKFPLKAYMVLPSNDGERITMPKEHWNFKPEPWFVADINAFMQKWEIDDRTEAIHKYVLYLKQTQQKTGARLQTRTILKQNYCKRQTRWVSQSFCDNECQESCEKKS